MVSIVENPANLKHFPVPPLPTTEHRASGSLCSMPWCSYWRWWPDSGVCVCGVLVSHLTVRWCHSCLCSLERSAPGPQRAGGGTFERDGVLERLTTVRAGVRFHRATGSFCCRSDWWSPNVVKRCSRRAVEGLHSAYCSLDKFPFSSIDKFPCGVTVGAAVAKTV